MTTVEITTIRGEKFKTDVEDFNPQAIFEQLNSTDGPDAPRMIVIGQIIMVRTDVARIVPVG